MTNNLDEISENIKKLDNEIAAAEKELVQAEAKQEMFQKQGLEFGVNNLQEAEDKLNSNELKKEAISKEILDLYNQMQELYEW